MREVSDILHNRNPETGQWDAVPPGTIVYRYGSPQSCGVVLEDLGPDRPGRYNARILRVLWGKDGSVTEVNSLGLNDLWELLRDSERKAKTHRKNVDKLTAMYWEARAK